MTGYSGLQWPPAQPSFYEGRSIDNKLSCDEFSQAVRAGFMQIALFYSKDSDIPHLLFGNSTLIFKIKSPEIFLDMDFLQVYLLVLLSSFFFLQLHLIPFIFIHSFLC